MTTRDQQAMNEQLTQLRQEGLSIDGDNLYKDDLIDVAIGAMLRGYQIGQEPPEGHWAWRFYEIGKAEREALARVEAQLAEAVGLLDRTVTQVGRTITSELREEIDAFLIRRAHMPAVTTEQSIAISQRTRSAYVAHAAQLEAQSAQPVDDRSVFEGVAKAQGLSVTRTKQGLMFANGQRREVGDYIDLLTLVSWHFWQARAAQPAAPMQVEVMSFEYVDLSSERRTVTITRDDVIESMEDTLYDKLGDQICHCESVGETDVVDCNCQDYIEQFTLVRPHSSLPNSSVYALRGAEHE